MLDGRFDPEFTLSLVASSDFAPYADAAWQDGAAPRDAEGAAPGPAAITFVILAAVVAVNLLWMGWPA